MPAIRALFDALRAAAVWLLVAAVICGPAGVGTSVAFGAATKSCGIACPCDAAPASDDEPCDDQHGQAQHGQAQHPDVEPNHLEPIHLQHGEAARALGDHEASDHDRREGPHDDSAHGEHDDDGDPCGDACPDDCPNCRCAPAIAVTVVLPTLASGPACGGSGLAFAPIEAPPSGSRRSVFRPPRALG